MRIAIVNSYPLAVRLIRRVIDEDGNHIIAWVARDGIEAEARFVADRPDLLLLDLIMPQLDVVRTIRLIMGQGGCPILIVAANVREQPGLVFEAMGAGALDAVNLPSLTVLPEQSARELLRKIATLERLQRRTPTAGRPTAAQKYVGAGVGQEMAARAGRRQALIAIGASTGGPKTLAQVLGKIPAGLSTAFVVVQHIDAQFAPGLLSWLNSQIPMEVIAAEPGKAPAPGRVCLSMNNDHLVLEANGRFAHVSEPRDEPYRPSVDVFFRSLVRNWRLPGQAVLLTGMGRDGGAGLLALRQAGWHTIAQDAASSVVYGMPKAAAELGAAIEILPDSAIAASLLMRAV